MSLTEPLARVPLGLGGAALHRQAPVSSYVVSSPRALKPAQPWDAAASNESSGFSADDVRLRCNGMLTADVYQRVFDTAFSAEGTTFIEVGTAHAAATVCLALGLKASGRTGTIYSFEKIVGGSRERFGGVDRNIKIIEDNLCHFGVRDYVELVVGDVSETHSRVPAGQAIDLLMLDADGMIDRDVRLFYDLLQPACPIIIDDVADVTRLKAVGGRRYRVDQKLRLSYLLLQEILRHGLVEEGETIGATFFSRKTDRRADDLPYERVMNVYRSLVFADAEAPPWYSRRAMMNAVEQVCPLQLERLKAVVRRTRMAYGTRTALDRA